MNDLTLSYKKLDVTVKLMEECLVDKVGYITMYYVYIYIMNEIMRVGASGCG